MYVLTFTAANICLYYFFLFHYFCYTGKCWINAYFKCKVILIILYPFCSYISLYVCPSVELYHSRKHTCWKDVKLMFSLSFGSWAKMMLTHLPLWQKSIPIYPFIFRHQFRSIFWEQHQLAWKNTNIAPDFMGQYLGQMKCRQRKNTYGSESLYFKFFAPGLALLKEMLLLWS